MDCLSALKFMTVHSDEGGFVVSGYIISQLTDTGTLDATFGSGGYVTGPTMSQKALHGQRDRT